MLPVSSVHLVLNAGSDPRTWCWCPVSAGFLCFTRLWECSGARRQWQLLSACSISDSLSLVLLSVNQSSDKERATAAAHTPGAKKKKRKREIQPGCLSPPPLPLLWLQPSSLPSKPTPVSVSEALQRWKGICNAPPLTVNWAVLLGGSLLALSAF